MAAKPIPRIALYNDPVLIKLITVEPPVSDPPKFHDLVGGSRLRESNQGGSLQRSGLTYLIRREFIAHIFQVTIRAVLGCH